MIPNSHFDAWPNPFRSAPPTVRSVRLLVPLSSCNEAATYIIEALGGPELCKKLTGGVRWWQVRGLQGIDANWVVTKKDIESLRKDSRQKRKDSKKEDEEALNSNVNHAHGKKGSATTPDRDDSATYATEMDSMPCMYYLHGGEICCDY